MEIVVKLVLSLVLVVVSAKAGQLYEKRKNKIRICLTHEQMEEEWQSWTDLGHQITFEEFIQIRYNLFAKPNLYRNKIVLLGIGRNRLETLAIIRNK